MDTSRLPSPNEYADWQSWAAVLISSLASVEQSAINIPMYVANAKDARGGYPPAIKGDFIWINEGGVRKLAVWDGQKWIKYSPDN